MTSAKFSLAGKVAIVTGAASGIGFAIVQAFLESGIAGITLVDLSESALAHARAQLDPAARSKSHFVAVDCSESAAAETYVAETVARFGRVDVSVQCAGVCPAAKSILDTDAAEFDRVMAVNVRGVWLGAKASLKAMLSSAERESEARVSRDKCILLISSQIGLDGMAGLSPYSASKFALRGLAAALAQECGPLGVRVNSLAPGPVNTELYRTSFPHKAEHEARASLNRAGEPDEIALSAVYLASDAAAYVTGTTLKVDGGWSKWC
ncbi:hypothetical protein JCM11491_000067 [Sporobolomyces phaffii]